MILVTGDCHGDFARLLTFDRGARFTKRDYVVVCGDFGYFPEADVMDERLDTLNAAPFTTLFVDGNHEDFCSLNSLPEEQWMGGRVHFLRPSVIHLMRGELFCVDGVKLFSFGGARSTDIRSGLFDVNDYRFGENDAELFEDIKAAEQAGLMYRVVNKTWWREELPSQDEMARGLDRLKSAGKVDAIFTHCAPDSVQSTYFPDTDANEFTAYLDTVRKTVKFKRWFFGHYHMDVCLPGKFTCVHKDVIRI